MSGGHVRLGDVESITMTLKQQRLELPASFVAVQQTGVVPTGKTLPEVGTQTMVESALQLVVAVAVKLTTAPSEPVHSAVMSGGQEIEGVPEYVTVTLKQQRDELPASSVAVQQTSVVPLGKRLPDAGAHVIVGLGSHVSEAITV